MTAWESILREAGGADWVVNTQFGMEFMAHSPDWKKSVAIKGGCLRTSFAVESEVSYTSERPPDLKPEKNGTHILRMEHDGSEWAIEYLGNVLRTWLGGRGAQEKLFGPARKGFWLSEKECKVILEEAGAGWTEGRWAFIGEPEPAAKKELLLKIKEAFPELFARYASTVGSNEYLESLR